MKILYSPVFDEGVFNTPIWTGDYMADTVFHGLRRLLGLDCVDVVKMHHMYTGYTRKSELYGKGFTLFGRLPDIEINRSYDQDFDAVVVPIHHREQNNRDKIYKHIINLKKRFDKIAIIDGFDFQQYDHSLSEYGTVFKREFIDGPAYPISFGCPDELVVNEQPFKYKFCATVIPGIGHWYPEHIINHHTNTYVFDNEEDYYSDYKASLFGITMKKAGWDCLRHYEILMCGCVPYFVDIESCPTNILVNFPKNLCKEVKALSGLYYNGFNLKLVDKFDFAKYKEINEQFLNNTRNYLTTKSVAKYILERII